MLVAVGCLGGLGYLWWRRGQDAEAPLAPVGAGVLLTPPAPSYPSLLEVDWQNVGRDLVSLPQGASAPSQIGPLQDGAPASWLITGPTWYQS
jgi:hypothetical protein